jgi:hypothetical protein
MSTPIDAELASLLDQAEIVAVLEGAVAQITYLQRRVCELGSAVAQSAAQITDLRARAAMLEATAPPWFDAR